MVDLETKCLWLFPHYQWKYYGPILFESKSYEEFVIKCDINGYVNPDVSRRYDETIPLINRYEPYEEFIFSEACGWRGTGKMNAKARKFRDQLIKHEIELGERDKDGVIIPSKYEILNNKQTYSWCKVYHPNFLKIRGIE